MRLFILFLLSGFSLTSKAQQRLLIQVIGEDKAPVTASIILKGTGNGYTADSLGKASITFPANGEYDIVITAAAYEKKEIKITIPHSSDILLVELESIEHELEQVIVQSTRTSRSISNVPTRVETISLEE